MRLRNEILFDRHLGRDTDCSLYNPDGGRNNLYSAISANGVCNNWNDNVYLLSDKSYQGEYLKESYMLTTMSKAFALFYSQSAANIVWLCQHVCKDFIGLDCNLEHFFHLFR